MAGRTFEEQVRAELGALRLKPDEQVWLHVEAALQKDKKRRWLIWLLAGLVAGGALGIYAYQNNATEKTEMTEVSNKSENKQPSISSEKQSPKETKESSAEPSVPVESYKADQSSAATYHANTDKNLRSVSAEKPGAVKNKTVSARLVNESEQHATPSAKTFLPIPKTETAGKQETNEASQLVVQSSANKEGLVTAPVAVTTTLNTDSAAKANSVPAITQKEAITSLVDTANETPLVVAKSVEVKKRKTPWRLFGNFDIGMSSLLSGFGAKADMLYAAPPANAGNNGNTLYNGAAYKEPQTLNGVSFGLGLQAIKPIAKRTDIGLGIGYQFYQSGFTIGRPVDADSVKALINGNSAFSSRLPESRNYYLSSDSVRYNNNWHFAEFAVDLYHRMKLGGTTVLRLRFGIGADLLIASNALQYNHSAAVLYEDPASRHKIQFNFSTGFDLGFGRQQNLHIGPQFSFFLTPATNNSGSYFARWALRAGVAIPKRKK